jgi:hypothetical protein
MQPSDDAVERHRTRHRPDPDLQSNFRISSNSEGANCRPAALVTWTRHPDLKSMRALATVSVGLVICTIAVSPSLEDDIVKPTFRVGTEPVMRGASGMLSKTAFGLFAGLGTGGGASVDATIGAGFGGSGAMAPAWIADPAELRDLDSLNHSTLLSTLSANRAAFCFVVRLNLHPDITQGKPAGFGAMQRSNRRGRGAGFTLTKSFASLARPAHRS